MVQGRLVGYGPAFYLYVIADVRCVSYQDDEFSCVLIAPRRVLPVRGGLGKAFVGFVRWR